MLDGEEEEVLTLDEEVPPADEQEEEEETRIGFGDDLEQENEDDPDLVKNLRGQLREAHKKIAEVAKAPQAPAPAKKIEVGPRPKIADFDYDDEKFDAATDKWLADTQAAKDQESEADKAQRQAREQFQSRQASYEERRAKLKVPDYADAEETVIASLGKTVFDAIVLVASDPEKLTYALGRSPTKLADLAKIKDPAVLLYTIGKLEGNLRVTNTKRNPPPPPEKVTRGNASVAVVNTNKQLEKLEKEAERTGDRTKIQAWKREQKAKQA